MVRRTFLVVSMLAALVGCGERSQPAAERRCREVPAPDTETAQGWVGWLAAHRDDAAVALDDGRGVKVSRRVEETLPLASAGKVLHLGAYAIGVAEGRLRPDDPVRLADWEAWHLPGTDGGAHQKSLEHLGVPHDNGRAREPDRTIRLDDLVAVMIRFSDNAAPELLRARLGDDALRRAGDAGGWPDPDLPSFLGSVIALLAPDLVPGDDRAARGAVEWELARRYTTEGRFRTEIAGRSLPDLPAQARWAERSAAGSAAQLNNLHRAISTGSFKGAELARRHLEWQPPPAGAQGLGFKGGSLPSVLTEAITLRRTDGTTASAVLLARRMSAEDWQVASRSLAHQRLLIAALDEPQTMERIRCAL